jgi:cysteinyl-tRNA synthetase
MSYELLGESFDIHGGGNDLIFPHHENEIAQSCCAHPEGSFANFWLHNEMLQVEGKKMSKSLGNFFTVRDLLDQGVPGEVIRFVFLSTHYRKPMDWTAEKAEQAESRLLEYNKIISDYADAELADENKVSMQIVEALSNDLNTHLALTRLHEFALHAKSIGRSDNGAMALQLAHDLKFLGIWTEHFGKIPRSFWLDKASELTIDQQALIATLLSKRADAKEARNFDRADEIRDLLRTAGVVVTDTPRGPEWGLGPDFDPAKLEPLK